MKDKPDNSIQMYQPSERLKEAQRELLERYPLEEIIRTLKLLSRSMVSGEMAYEDTVIDKKDRGDMVQARTMGIIGEDLLSVCSLIQTIADHEPLEKSMSHEGGNAGLQLFDGKPRKVPPVLKQLTGSGKIREQSPLERCIAVTKKWCTEQSDILDEQATEIARNAKGSSPENLEFITKRLEFLDKAGGMFHYLEKWSKVAIEEVNKVKRMERGGNSAQGIA